MTLRRRTLLKQFGVGAAGLGIASLFPRHLSAGNGSAQGHLPRSTPQAQGVPAAAISQFLAAVDKSRLELRSLMVVRHGHVVAEGSWTPYQSGDAYVLNSLSKCFTSTAVGFAVAEGRLTIADRVLKFFPEDLPATVSDNLAALSVKDLLTLSIGHATDSMPIITREQNWVKAFLSLPIEHTPGSAFLYDSGGSYMLSAIVQKLSGQKVIDYLKPRFFDPLAMHGMTWQTCPRGINTGGWGMVATTETLAKLSQFYLQRGRWNGVQLLPAAWVSAATSKQVSSKSFSGDQTPDWEQGYGYQFWQCRHNTFRGDGAGGQFCIVFPEQDAVVVMTGSTRDMQGLLDLVWTHLLPAMQEKTPGGDDPAAQTRLKRELASLTIPPPTGSASSPMAGDISGKNFSLEPNRLEASSVSFEFGGSSTTFKLKRANAVSELRCGFGRWLDNHTAVFDLTPVETAAAGAWKNANTFEMQWLFSMGHGTLVCRFDGDAVSISFPPPETELLLTGRLSTSNQDHAR